MINPAPASLGVLNQGSQPDARPSRRPSAEPAGNVGDDEHRPEARLPRAVRARLRAVRARRQAPSLSLQSVFQRFSVWLKSVYRSITQRSAEDVLQVTLTDEVRQVMDRMIATDEQIARSAGHARDGPAVRRADQAGMTPEQWAQYHELAAQATARPASSFRRAGCATCSGCATPARAS